MTEYEVQLQIRLGAIEYLLCNLYASALLEKYAAPVEAADLAIENMRHRLKRWAEEPAPGIDPTLSDHIHAELSNALEPLFKQIRRVVSEAVADGAGHGGV